MTKLYCPKGHELSEKIKIWIKYVREIGGYYEYINKCNDCLRSYLDIDCLTVAHDTNVVTKNSNSAEIDGIKTEAQLCDHDWQGGRDEIDGNLCLTCEKCNAIEVIQIETIPFKREKTESQIAVDRVVEALDKTIEAIQDVSNNLQDQMIWVSFERLKLELKELNK